MESNRILLFRSESGDPSPMDQSLGARLSALEGPAHSTITVEEEVFCRDDLADMEKKLVPWKGKVSGVIGATNVPESTRLGELSDEMKILCFVANNNPSVWQRRKHVFHIGLPSAQTAEAVALLLQKTKRKRIFLLYDQTEFQRRFASSVEAALKNHKMEVSSRAELTDADFESLMEWRPDLVYMIFSSERKSLSLVQKIRELSQVPLLFGRSLLRESFLSALDDVGKAWFVDMFHRNRTQNVTQKDFFRILSARGINVPTANHAFGWDAMSFCALGLEAGRGQSLPAIDYLESGVALEGVTGTCFFSRDNHNGRSGSGPTTLTRWYRGRLEEVVTF